MCVCLRICARKALSLTPIMCVRVCVRAQYPILDPQHGHAGAQVHQLVHAQLLQRSLPPRETVQLQGRDARAGMSCEERCRGFKRGSPPTALRSSRRLLMRGSATTSSYMGVLCGCCMDVLCGCCVGVVWMLCGCCVDVVWMLYRSSDLRCAMYR